MRVFRAFLATAYAADTSPETALTTCKEVFGQDATSSRLGEGEQAVVYKCENSTLTSALKIYKKPHELVGNPSTRIKVDKAVGEAGNGPKVYGSKSTGFPLNWDECCSFNYCEDGIPEAEYVNCADCSKCGEDAFYAKFEEFLSGENVKAEDLSKKETYEAVATRIAQLHQMKKEDIDIEINYCSEPWPWNTKAMRVHLSNPIFTEGLAHIEKRFSDLPVKGGNLTFAGVQDIYDYALELVERSNSPVVMSHNDVHAGNIFLKNGDGAVLDRLTLVDFDNAAFGPRAWDLLYYFFNWQSELGSLEHVDGYLTKYTDVYNSLSPPRTFTKEEIGQEFLCFQPWYLLERTVFLHALNPDWGKGFTEVLRAVLTNFADGVSNCKVPEIERYSEYPTCETTQSDNAWTFSGSTANLQTSILLVTLLQLFLH